MVIVYSCSLYIVFLCFVLFSLFFFVEFFLYMNKILPTLTPVPIHVSWGTCEAEPLSRVHASLLRHRGYYIHVHTIIIITA